MHFSRFCLKVLLFLVGGAFGGNRGLSPVPPEKGVFPLDHMHLCDLVMLRDPLMNIIMFFNFVSSVEETSF